MTKTATSSPRVGSEHVNEVRLTGRVSGAPTDKELPSGDVLVSLRVVIDRPPRARRAVDRREVDTIDLACWSARSRASALRADEGDLVEVHGSLRRRFYRAGGAVASRYEVEVRSLRRI